MIHIIVGEREFNLSEETIRKIGYFKNMLEFESLSGQETKENENIFVDRDGDTFAQILKLVRGYNVPVTNDMRYDMDFYMIDILADEAEPYLEIKRRLSIPRKLVDLLQEYHIGICTYMDTLDTSNRGDIICEYIFRCPSSSKRYYKENMSADDLIHRIEHDPDYRNICDLYTYKANQNFHTYDTYAQICREIQK